MMSEVFPNAFFFNSDGTDDMSSTPLSNKIITKARATRPDIASQYASPLGMAKL